MRARYSQPVASKVTVDYPAAHSMDSQWFAIDEEGNVAVFETGEAGAMPGAAAGESDRGYEWLESLRGSGGQLLVAPYSLRGERTSPSHVNFTALGQQYVILFMGPESRDQIPSFARVLHTTTGIGVVCDTANATPEAQEWFRHQHAEGNCLECYATWHGFGEADGEVGAGGVYQYDHVCENWAAGPYALSVVPQSPLRATDLPQAIRDVAVKLPGRFADTPYVQPAEHMESHAWGDTWLATDFLVERPLEGMKYETSPSLSVRDTKDRPVYPVSHAPRKGEELLRNADLEAQIRAEWWEDAPRDVYADWLLERGSPLGTWFAKMKGKVSLREFEGPERDEMNQFLSLHGECIFGRKLWWMQRTCAAIYAEDISPFEMMFHEGYLSEVSLTSKSEEEIEPELGARVRIGTTDLWDALSVSPLAVVIDGISLEQDEWAFRSMEMAAWPECPLRQMTLRLRGQSGGEPLDAGKFRGLKYLKDLTFVGGRMRFPSATPLLNVRSLTLRADYRDAMPSLTLEAGALPDLESLSLVGFNTSERKTSPGLSVLEQLNAHSTPKLSSLRIVALGDFGGLFARILPQETAATAIASIAKPGFFQRLFGSTPKPLHLGRPSAGLPQDAMIGRLTELCFNKTQIDASSFAALEPYAAALGHLTIRVDKGYVQAAALDYFAKVGLRVVTR